MIIAVIQERDDASLDQGYSSEGGETVCIVLSQKKGNSKISLLYIQ